MGRTFSSTQASVGTLGDQRQKGFAKLTHVKRPASGLWRTSVGLTTSSSPEPKRPAGPPSVGCQALPPRRARLSRVPPSEIGSLPDEWNQSVTHLLGVIRIAGQVPLQHGLFVEGASNQERHAH